MRRLSVPVETIAGPEALLAAWRTYRRGKRRRPDVAAFELDAERRIIGLSRALLGGGWRHGSYRVLRIDDPKARLIAVAPVAERVLHVAVHRATAPFLHRRYDRGSFACLPGRGSHRAILRFRELMCRHRFFLHLDVNHYFPSVDHEILMALLSRWIRGDATHAVLAEILRSGAELYRRPAVARFFGLQARPERPQGLPIGNLTSQEWGNLYLDGLDQHLSRVLKVKGHLRYQDDIVIFGDDLRTMAAWRDEAEGWLREQRRLTLTPGTRQIHPANRPHVFLGHRITRAGWSIGPRAARRFRHTLPALPGEPDDRITARLQAWRAIMAF